MPQFDDGGEEMLEAGLFDLISAFKEMLERRKTLLSHEVADEGKSIDQRMDELMELIREGESVEFVEVFATQQTKGDMIVTFLALLELIRLKRVKVYQRGVFGAIRVFRPVGPDVEARRRRRATRHEGRRTTWPKKKNETQQDETPDEHGRRSPARP